MTTCIACFVRTVPRKRAKGLCANCYAKKRRKDHPGEWKKYKDKEKANRASREHRKRRKEAIFQQLGSICVCCGISDKRFLSIDHIHGGGTKHVRSVGHYKIETEILNNPNASDKYQILCFLCNHAKYLYGECPHQEVIRKVNQTVV